MSVRLSTGLRNGMLNASGFKEIFTDSVIHIYSGPPPLDADAAVQGQLLGRVTLNGAAFIHGAPAGGLEFGTPAGGVIGKATAELWQMVGTTGGTAGWFRLMGNPVDDLAFSLVLPRMDGSIAVSGGDLNLSTTTVVVGTPVTIDTFQFTLPPT